MYNIYICWPMALQCAHNHSLLLFFFFFSNRSHVVLAVIFEHTQCIFFECNTHVFFQLFGIQSHITYIQKKITIMKTKIPLCKNEWTKWQRMRKKTHTLNGKIIVVSIKEPRKRRTSNFDFKNIFILVSQKKHLKILFCIKSLSIYIYKYNP